jgi:hypothetical protein
MSYRYDIFISYRRDEETKRWIDDHFVPLLKHRVRSELKRPLDIYIDDKLEAGVFWPSQLGEEISLSRILIPLWSGDYLNSVWCTCEITHMLEREINTDRNGKQNTTRLIFPVIVHDGENLPLEISGIQYIDVKKFFNSRMNIYNESAEKLSYELGNAAQGIANLIINAPPIQSDWKIEAVNKFYNQYYEQARAEQVNLSKFTS